MRPEFYVILETASKREKSKKNSPNFKNVVIAYLVMHFQPGFDFILCKLSTQFYRST